MPNATSARRWARGVVFALAAAFALVCAAFATGCSSGDDPVVARVNGEELRASTLTSFIDATRANLSSTSDEDWEAYLEQNGYTVDEYWNYLINYYAYEMVMSQKCDEEGIEVSDEEVDARIAQMKESVGAVDENSAFLWDLYVEGYGSEEALRGATKYYMRLAKLYEQEVPREDPTDEEVQAYAGAYGTSYASTRTSAIAFEQEEYNESLHVCDALLADPEADFSAYSDEYNDSETLRANGGDMGWTLLANLPSTYLAALEGLSVGEVYSNVVWDEGTGMYYVIKVTDEYDALPNDDGTFDIVSMPEELAAQLRADAKSEKWSNACTAYADELFAQADIEVLIEHQYDVAGQKHDGQ